VKILYVIESFGPGGKERRLSQLIDYFSEVDGVELEVVLTREEFHYKTVLEKNIRIHAISKKLGVGKNSGFRQFYKICRNFKPDVIHTWGGLITVLAIPSSVLCGIPIIDGQVTATTHPPLWEKWLFYKIPFLFSKKVVSNSRLAFKVYGMPTRKSICIYNGFDFSRLNKVKDVQALRKDLSITTQYIVAMVASYVPLKDYKTFIEAAIQVLKTGKDVTFLGVGGQDPKVFQKYIPEEYEDKIRLLRQRSDIESFMSMCDVGVLSSFSEGMPNVVLEFMALGKAVIATPVGGVPELIDNNIDGFIFEIGDQQHLSNLIVDLLDDESKRLEVGKKAARKIKESFSSKKMNEAYLHLYKNILHK
jgi:glycosyltransferase involved in cell wall biosynthesis